MKPVVRLVLRFVLWGVPALAITYGVLGQINPSSVDENYVKLCSGSEISGLLLGSSRMSQGLDPDRLFRETPWEGRVLNFAFTNQTSPYGELYSEVIRSRTEGWDDGIFLLEVSPWIFARDKREPEPRERGRTLEGLWQVKGHPNVQYLVSKMEKHWYQVLGDPTGALACEYNGWLHVTREYTPEQLQARRTQKIKAYQALKPHYALDSLRLMHFSRLVEDLGAIGTVVGIQLPVSHEMGQLEDAIFHDFDKWLADLDMPLIRMRDSLQYSTHDGNHLMQSSAIALSDKLRSHPQLNPTPETR